MEFVSANPSVVRSIKQRVLLNDWLRAARRCEPLPLVSDFSPDDVGDEIADIMGYDVVSGDNGARFVITQQGARLSATDGNDRNEPHKWIGRYLDEGLGPDRYARVLPSYLACLACKRPTYSISTVRDADGKDVSYERLLLPFGKADAVEQIVGSFKAISVEGGFKVNNLIGLKSRRVPVTVINAVIDLDFVPAPPVARAGEEIVELG
jgi:hypothetical protein